MALLRWYAFRIRFHPWTTDELPKLLGTAHDYIRLMRLDRPIGIYLLLWPTLWAVWIGGRGRPQPLILIIFVAGWRAFLPAGGRPHKHTPPAPYAPVQAPKKN